MLVEFSTRASKALSYARDEADRMGHGSIGPVELWLGLAQQESGVALNVLTALGVDYRKVDETIRARLTKGPHQPSGGVLPFSPRARTILLYAIAETHALKRNEIGTEQLLMGLMIDGQSTPARLMSDLGITALSVRAEVLNQRGLTIDQVGPIPHESVQFDPPKELLGGLLGSYASHLPPISEAGRKVRRILYLTTPMPFLTLLLCEFWRIRLPEMRGIPLLGLAVFLPIFAWLLFLGLFRLQAYTLELMIILTAGSLPIGYALNAEPDPYESLFIKTALAVLLIAGGSVWGLSVAQRSGESRPWPRLGLIVLGWGMWLGVISWLPFADAVVSHQPNTSLWLRLAMLSLVALLVLGGAIEWNCHRKYGPMRIW